MPLQTTVLLRALRGLRVSRHASRHCAPGHVFGVVPCTGGQDLAQRLDRLPHVGVRHVQRRKAKAQDVGRPEVAGQSARNQRPHDRPRGRVGEAHVAAAVRMLARCHQPQPLIPGDLDLRAVCPGFEEAVAPSGRQLPDWPDFRQLKRPKLALLRRWRGI